MKLGFVLVLVAVVNGHLDLEEGDSCGPDDEWECKAFEDCSIAQEQLKKGIPPEICSFVRYSTIVCCEPFQLHDPLLRQGNSSDTNPPPCPSKPRSKWTVSEFMCEKYSMSVKELQDDPVQGPDGPKIEVDHCAWKAQPLVSGGVNANQMEYPHMVQIGYGKPPNEEYLCGGSLISERWVVTAAHCSKLETQDNSGKTRAITPKFVRMGDVAPNDDSDHVKPIKVKIIERINHPDYKPNRRYNDIALYKLASDVKFTPHIRPICLQVDDPIDLSRNNPPTAIGFGATSYGGSLETRLQKVNLTMISIALCQKSFSSDSFLPTGLSSASMICAGDHDYTGKDTCVGDSGSSLQIRLKCPWYCMHSLIGVTSFGKSVCANENTQGIYTKVSNYVSWIESIVWPEEKVKWKAGITAGIHFPSS